MKKLVLFLTIFISASAFAKTPLDTKNAQARVTIDYFLEAWQVYEIVSAYPIKPARNSAAAPLIIQALIKKYPCHSTT